jgi:type IV pilus assembly protein PilC
MPIIKTLVHETALSRITHSLAIATQAGTPLLSAMELSQKMVNNTLFQRALYDAHRKLSEGQSLHESLSDSLLFPSYLKNLIKTGEKSGKLDLMLEKTALHYEESVSFHVDQLSELIEPLIMVALGIMIGALIIAMYLPIFNLGSVIA